MSGQFSLTDCIFDYKKAIKLHGDDVLAHSNWELAEWWLRKYSSGQSPVCNDIKVADTSEQQVFG